MKRSVAALLLPLISVSLPLGLSILEQYGPNCSVETSIECFLEDLKKTKCDDFVPVSIDQCDSSLTLTFVYHYCNWNDNLDIDVFEDLTEIKVANQAYTDVLDISDMQSNTCRSYEMVHIVDTCEKANVPASIKFEGKVVGAKAKEGFYCYGYTWKMWKFPKLFPSPSPTPTLTPPTLTPTSKPTCSIPTFTPTVTIAARPSPLPSPNHVSARPTTTDTIYPTIVPSLPPSPGPLAEPTDVLPDPIITLSVECFREHDNALGSGVFDVPCSLPLSNAFEDPVCLRDLRYSYIITNESGEKVHIKLLYVKTDGFFSTLIDVDDNFVIERRGQHIENEIFRTNLCIARKHEATVIAAGLESEAVVANVAYYDLCVESPVEIRIFSISCKVGLLSCNDYITSIEHFGECNMNASFHYAVENYGSKSLYITSAAMSIGSVGYEVLSLQGINPAFPSKDIKVFEQTKVIDFCSVAGRRITFTMKIIEYSFAFLTYANLDFVRLLTSHPTNPPQTVVPTNVPTFPPKTMQPTPTECTDLPYKVSFKYEGRRCDESDNSQFEMKERYLRRAKGGSSSYKEKKKKSMCKDTGRYTYPPMISAVVISSKTGNHLYFDSKVSEGDHFEITSGNPAITLAKELEIKIYTTKGNLVQSFPLNLSCDNLFAGDTFGSLEIVSFK